MQIALHSAPRTEVDILIVGAGLAGLSTAILLAREGFSVIALDHASPTPDSDLRTTALLQPAIDTLREAGVWPRVEHRAASLKAIRLIDAGARGPKGGTDSHADFSAAEIDRSVFGANIANADLKRGLLAEAGATAGLTQIAPARIVQLLLQSDGVVAQLDDGRILSARLAIGADGRRSAVRDAAGVSAFKHDYAQNALVFVVAHDAPHHDMSTEILAEGGPFTLVPFTPDPESERRRSSVVWMEGRARAARLMALSEPAFEAAVQERSLNVLGPLSLVSGRASWPIATILAARFHARRAALIAEAAHVTPPIGAQGLNMSLGDARTLRDILCEARAAERDIGDESVLSQLTRQRYGDVAARLATTAALNTAAIGSLRPVRELRRAGLSLLREVPILKRAAMRFGLG